MDDQKIRYLTIKLAIEKYQVNPEYLSSIQRADVDEAVAKLYQLQHRVLSSDEAQQLKVTQSELDQAVSSLQEQFGAAHDFDVALDKNGITLDGLMLAIKDELHCEKVMEFIATDIPALDREQAFAYYQSHRLNFSRTRSWQLSHILITVNDEFEENKRPNALKRIRRVRQQATAENFPELALQYSECPTALEQGSLGWCEEGKLFPEIESALQKMKKGEISEPIETEAGFHLVLSHDEKPPYIASFEEVWPYLQEKHTRKAKQYIQRQWLNNLLHKEMLNDEK